MIKRVGIGVFVLGLIITVVTTVNMVTRDEVMDISDNEVPRNENTYMVWTPVIGVIVMFIGGGLAFYGARREDRTTVRERR